MRRLLRTALARLRTALALLAWPLLIVVALWLSGPAIRLFMRDVMDLEARSFWNGSTPHATTIVVVAAVQGTLALATLVACGCMLVASAAGLLAPTSSHRRRMQVALTAWPGVLTMLLFHVAMFAPAVLLVALGDGSLPGYLRYPLTLILALGPFFVGVAWAGWPLRLAERPTLWGWRLLHESRMVTKWRDLGVPALIVLPVLVGAVIACVPLFGGPFPSMQPIAPVTTGWPLLASIGALMIALRIALAMLVHNYLRTRGRAGGAAEAQIGIPQLDDATAPQTTALVLAARRPWLGLVGLVGLVVVPGLVLLVSTTFLAIWLTPAQFDRAWFEQRIAQRKHVDDSYERFLNDAGALFDEETNPVERYHMPASFELLREHALRMQPAVAALLERWRALPKDRLGYPPCPPDAPGHGMDYLSTLRALHTLRAALADTSEEFAAVLRDARAIAQPGLETGVVMDGLVQIAAIGTPLGHLGDYLDRTRGQLTPADLRVLDDVLVEMRLADDVAVALRDNEALWLYDQLRDPHSALNFVPLDPDLTWLTEGPASGSLALAAVVQRGDSFAAPSVPPGLQRSRIVSSMQYDLSEIVGNFNATLNAHRVLLRVEAYHLATGQWPAMLSDIDSATWDGGFAHPLARDPQNVLGMPVTTAAWVGPGQFSGRVAGGWWGPLLTPVTLPPGLDVASALDAIGLACGITIQPPADEATAADPWPDSIPLSCTGLQMLDMFAALHRAVYCDEWDGSDGESMFRPDTDHLPSIGYDAEMSNPFRSYYSVGDGNGGEFSVPYR